MRKCLPVCQELHMRWLQPGGMRPNTGLWWSGDGGNKRGDQERTHSARSWTCFSGWLILSVIMFYISYSSHYTPVPFWKMTVSPCNVSALWRQFWWSFCAENRFKYSSTFLLSFICHRSDAPAQASNMINFCLKIWMKMTFLSLVFHSTATEEDPTTFWWQLLFFMVSVVSMCGCVCVRLVVVWLLLRERERETLYLGH